MSLDKIFEKWVEITEVSPDCNVFTSKNFDIYSYNDSIKRLLKYNGNESDAIILLDSFLTEFLKSRSVSLFDIYNKNSALEEKIKSIIEVKKLIEKYNIEDYLNETIENYKRAIEFYGIDLDKVQDVLNNNIDLIELKVNSLFAYESLKPKQFKKGNYSENIPKYNKNIYAFYDINILLNTIMNNDEFNGITLSAIIDKESFESSYFCFTIKNGDNVYLIGDVPEYEYPNQKYFRRTPGRQMSRRIELFNFPYELLAIKGDRYGYSMGKDTNELAVCENYHLLGSLSDCNAYSIIWIINMMSILKEKYFDNHIQTDTIYYTGAMIQIEGIEQKEYNLVVKNDYSVIEMDKLTKKDVIDSKIKFSRETRGENLWVVERYIDKVDDSLINNVCEDDYTKISYETALSIPSNKTIERLNENFNVIATKEEFDYRQKWIARYNCANAIDILFKKEWDEKHYEIEEWYRKSLEANSENILKAIAYGEFITEEHNYQKLTPKGKEKFNKGEKYSSFSDDGDIVVFGRELNVRNNNILKVDVWNDNDSYVTMGRTVLFQKDRRNLKIGWHYGCFVDGKKPAICATFKVTSPKAIADLCGCTINDLPDLIKNYCYTKDFSAGNHLLDNIDPMDWVIQNYASEFNAEVIVLLSKKSYNDLRKKYGLEPNKIWLND